jgi:hypothetical protein
VTETRATDVGVEAQAEAEAVSETRPGGEDSEEEELLAFVFNNTNIIEYKLIQQLGAVSWPRC